ncbi:hypothetical protein [Aeromonas caviae]|uniref:hypothetical protein n=1 Tax=Aeromonas caviae TaxID=648 RepID=UPI00311EC8B6
MDRKTKVVILAGRLIWFIGALLLLIPSGLYFYIFIPASNHTLSAEHAAWASFGSYFGGTIGPIISGFAFIGIWKTYNLQRKQLQQANDQRKSEDIQRLIISTSERIDSILKTPIDLLATINGINKSGEIYDIDKTIAFLYGISNDKYPNVQDLVPKIKALISIELTQINEEAENLSWLLEHHKDIFNEDVIINYYYFRYGPKFQTMLKIGVRLQPITLDVFKLHHVKVEE